MPLGAGLGSSAAFSVALAGALLRLRLRLYADDRDDALALVHGGKFGGRRPRWEVRGDVTQRLDDHDALATVSTARSGVARRTGISSSVRNIL